MSAFFNHKTGEVERQDPVQNKDSLEDAIAKLKANMAEKAAKAETITFLGQERELELAYKHRRETWDCLRKGSAMRKKGVSGNTHYGKPAETEQQKSERLAWAAGTKELKAERDRMAKTSAQARFERDEAIAKEEYEARIARKVQRQKDSAGGESSGTVGQNSSAGGEGSSTIRQKSPAGGLSPQGKVQKAQRKKGGAVWKIPPKPRGLQRIKEHIEADGLKNMRAVVRRAEGIAREQACG